MYNHLQLREVFHLEFLRWFGRKVKSEYYAVKGGVNLRFFFKSVRYSEDMDLDAQGINKEALLEVVMRILESPSFGIALKPFGIERIVPPNIAKAKQTEVTQRFKTHLINAAGEDLFTKIEFSGRGYKGNIAVEPVSDSVTRMYKLPPLLVPHYDISSAVLQKIDALCARAVPQARDIFDLHVLSSQYNREKDKSTHITPQKSKRAHERIFDISFEEFRDSVLAYLTSNDQNVYGDPAIWDEVKLKTADFIEEFGGKNE